MRITATEFSEKTRQGDDLHDSVDYDVTERSHLLKSEFGGACHADSTTQRGSVRDS